MMYVPSWVIPTILTLLILAMMFRPNRDARDFDLTPIFRLFWTIPLCLVWIVYMGIMLLIH